MKRFIGAVAVGTALVALPADATPAYRHHHHGFRHYSRLHHVPGALGYADERAGFGAGPNVSPSEEPLGSGRYNPYVGYAGPGSIVLNATERARAEPGVTRELAPDAKETATGGPVGGVPGFDGGQ